MAQTALGAAHRSTQNGALWTFQTGAGIFSSPIVAADGTVYFGSADQVFYALNPDGTTRWTIRTGEIIDSAGLLDDQGRVYFGSGDGTLRAADAKTGAIVWTMNAEPPAVTHAVLNWFEGNVAIGPAGTLYVPNDNFRLYAVDRTAGHIAWEFALPDQQWSLPAVDSATGNLYFGDNNLIRLLGENTFGLGPDGRLAWSSFIAGTVAASPLLTPDGKIVVGAFDGSAHAYAKADGTELWSVATRDHIYASPASLPDGTIVQASCDGTVYAIAPADGTLRWIFEAGTPIRSSPAVDADGDVYVGGGDGRMYVINPDGSLRFAIRLIDDVRNDLNASPALGESAAYIGGESGEMFSVPYDWCLRPQAENDARCVTSVPLRPDGVSLAWVNSFGDVQPTAPGTIEGNAPIILQLVVRSAGVEQVAILDSTSVQVTATPATDVSVVVSGDGKFMAITPRVGFSPGALTLAVGAQYLVNLTRSGLRLSGGQLGGGVATTIATQVAAPSGGALDASATYEISRVAIPLPTIMATYNQIGFDQQRYLLGTVTATPKPIAWMVGAKVPMAGGPSVVDPTTQAILPMSLVTSGDTATMDAVGLPLQVQNLTLTLQTFRLSTRYAPGGAPSGTAEIAGSAVCGNIPIYGSFLEQLGLCNPQTDVIVPLGAANVAERTDIAPPPAVGSVTFARTADAITASVTGSQVDPTQHLAALLVVDASSGTPVSLNYGPGTARSTAADGTLSGVSVPTTSMILPSSLGVYLMIDTTVGASGAL
jgi:outer membrane protein assembly factor BamB